MRHQMSPPVTWVRMLPKPVVVRSAEPVCSQRASIEPGQRVTVRFPEQHTHLFDTESGNRLG